jgi:LPS-assembly lipoprotein
MKKYIAIASILLLAACGFQPMYGRNIHEQTGVENELPLVDIGNIPDREGQYLRNALIDRFYRDGRPAETRYALSVPAIHEDISDLDITKSSDATRAQLQLSAEMTLTDKETNQVVIRRSLRSITSYNILGSEFATRVSEENARQNVLDDLARQIEMQINLYLKRN